MKLNDFLLGGLDLAGFQVHQFLRVTLNAKKKKKKKKKPGGNELT